MEVWVVFGWCLTLQYDCLGGLLSSVFVWFVFVFNVALSFVLLLGTPFRSYDVDGFGLTAGLRTAGYLLWMMLTCCFGLLFVRNILWFTIHLDCLVCAIFL